MSNLESEIQKATPARLLAALANRFPVHTRRMKRGVRVVVNLPSLEEAEAPPPPPQVQPWQEVDAMLSRQTTTHAPRRKSPARG